jgi:phosphate transport system substrate-binding protein
VSRSADTPMPGYNPAAPVSFPNIPPHLLAQMTPAELSGLIQTQRIPQPRSKTPLILGLSLGGIVAIAAFAAAVVLLKGTNTETTDKTPPTSDIAPAQPLADAHGAGSTFVQPLMKEWATEYGRTTNGKVTYNPDAATKYGSGFGIKGMTNRELDFGCTDAPLDNTQLSAASNKGGEVLHIPLAMGAVVPIYNVPELRGELRFTSELLAKIYLGHVTKWNDPAVKAANPTRANDLPSYDIKVVHRGTNSSGTSYIWTEFLASGDSEVRPANTQFASEIGVSTTPRWKEGGLAAPGNSEVAKAVQDNKGAIGYVELRFALSKNLTYGRVRNREDKYVEATLESVTAAADSILGGADFPRDLRFSLVNPPGPKSYPISGTVWAVVYAVPKSPEAGRATAEFLWWCVHDGQKLAQQEQYATLPETLIKRTEEKIRRIRGGEQLGKK